MKKGINELTLKGWGGRMKDHVLGVKRKRTARCRECLGKNESLSLAAVEGPKDRRIVKVVTKNVGTLDSGLDS